MPPAIKISYDLKPPEGVNTYLDPSKTQEFIVGSEARLTSSSTSTSKSPSTEALTSKSTATAASPAATAWSQTFYGDLRTALAEARKEVGDELTAWRDVVGKAEVGKEPLGKTKNVDGAEEEEGEDEDEGE